MIFAIIPSRTDEYLELLLHSLKLSEPGTMDHCVVADNGLSPEFVQRWSLTSRLSDLAPVWRCHFEPTPQPFCFAVAINRAVEIIPKGADILILNDDAAMVSSIWRTRAERLLRDPSLERYGLISLAIDGGVGNPEQKQVFWQTPDVVESEKTLCFVAVIIRRQAWNAVGPMDERFTAYGHDDDDYCYRLRAEGWKCGVTQRIVVTHGANGRPHSSSYMRYHGQDEMDRLFHENKQKYIEKWGGPPGHEKVYFEG